MESNPVKIDLVTKRPDGGCTLVLVETGPWIGEQKNQNMQRLGNRIAGCVSTVINGHVARRYPATIGVPLTIQVDSYDTPRLEVDILLPRCRTTSTNPQKSRRSSGPDDSLRQSSCGIAGPTLPVNWPSDDRRTGSGTASNACSDWA